MRDWREGTNTWLYHSLSISLPIGLPISSVEPPTQVVKASSSICSEWLHVSLVAFETESHWEVEKLLDVATLFSVTFCLDKETFWGYVEEYEVI